jgi:16S rRNA (cytidine1402-2'-O)-methyltransferase
MTHSSTSVLPHGTLYLVPCHLGEDTHYANLFPALNLTLIQSIKIWCVENVKSARRFISPILKLNTEITHTVQDLRIDEIPRSDTDNTHRIQQLRDLLRPALATKNVMGEWIAGQNIGIVSEAGCPGVADPGAELVAIAHELNIPVVPLIGPSSILLGLMASGFNGQSFAFNGYLPLKEPQRLNALKRAQQEAHQQRTQIFIETPYRNQTFADYLITHLDGTLRLCIASGLTTAQQAIITRPIHQWRTQMPQLNAKLPTLFLFL